MRERDVARYATETKDVATNRARTTEPAIGRQTRLNPLLGRSGLPQTVAACAPTHDLNRAMGPANRQTARCSWAKERGASSRCSFASSHCAAGARPTAVARGGFRIKSGASTRNWPAMLARPRQKMRCGRNWKPPATSAPDCASSSRPAVRQAGSRTCVCIFRRRE